MSINTVICSICRISVIMTSSYPAKFKSFFAQRGIDVGSGVLAVTVQRNRSTEYSTLIIDYTRDIVIANYPS